MEFGDYPTEEKKLNWKPIAIAVVGVVSALVLIFVAIRISNQIDSPEVVQKNIVKQQTEVLKSECDNSSDKDACIKNKTQQVAISSASVDLCKELEAEEADGCILLLAGDLLDPSLCNNISGTTKDKCNDYAYHKLAYKNKDVSACAKILDKNLSKGCADSIDPITAENCDQRNQEESYCNMLKVIDDASKKQDLSLCSVLDEAGQDQCNEMVSIDDPDFDGLETSAEEVYGSDPRNADTDGDGYNDGDEVNAGYDPAGEGRL